VAGVVHGLMEDAGIVGRRVDVAEIENLLKQAF
jgi:hypothetical protein